VTCTLQTIWRLLTTVARQRTRTHQWHGKHHVTCYEDDATVGAAMFEGYITRTSVGMTMTNDRPDLSSEGAPVIDKRILVNVNRNKYPVVRPSWALKPGLTDRLVVGLKVTLTLTVSSVPAVKQLVSLESAVRQVSCEGERILRCWQTATSENCEV
jgi:hypothetical protein